LLHRDPQLDKHLFAEMAPALLIGLGKYSAKGAGRGIWPIS